MKATAVLVGILLFFGLTGVAGANMVAGPLFPDSSDKAICEIVNISAYARVIRIQMISGSGTIVRETGLLELNPGTAYEISAPDGLSSQLLYCKFIGATSSSFRAAIGLFTPPAGSDKVALPAQ